MSYFKFFSFFAFVLLQIVGSAQTSSTLLWPIKNSAPGVNIIGKPGDTFSGIVNYADLYIGAMEGDTVVAPIDGIISSAHSSPMIPFRINFQNISIPRFGSAINDEEYRNAWAAIVQEQYPKLKLDIAKYISYKIGIKVGADEMYWISGLRTVSNFKTGETVRRGEVIGTVGYCDTTFKVPHIQFSHSVNRKAEDPLGVFGIPSTFKKYNSTFNFITDKHSVNNLVEAFKIMRTGLEQAHPGLYDYSPKEKMDSLFTTTQQSIKKPMNSEEFRVLITPIVAAIRDSHTALYPSAYSNAVRFFPEVSLGFVKDELRVTKPIKKYQINSGTPIIAINNQPVDDVIKFLRSQFYYVDGYNELPFERYLLSNFWDMYVKAYFPSESTPLILTLEDGQNVNVNYLPANSTKGGIDNSNMSIQMIKPSIGYININSFELNQVEEDSIQGFIQSLEKNKVSNLIIDVRNNRGGLITVLHRLTSYFITKPYQTSCYREVKSNSTYPAFRYTDNYSADDILFGDYNVITSKNTFIQPDTVTVIPSEINFSGKLYILVDEFSVSAASEFAAIILQQGIGTIIGRETGTCYYKMNAEKFAYFLLGSTGLNLMVPLVKLVSREVVHPRIPYGRGVIPDIVVPLSVEEFTQAKDVVLERALEVVEAQERASDR